MMSSWPSGTRNDQYDKCTTDAMTTTHVKKGVCLRRFPGKRIRLEMFSALVRHFAVWISRV